MPSHPPTCLSCPAIVFTCHCLLYLPPPLIQQQLSKAAVTSMTETLCRKQHSRRHPGITQAMRNALLQARQQDEGDLQGFIHLHSPRKTTLQMPKMPVSAHCLPPHTQPSPEEPLHAVLRHHPQTSVARKMGGMLKPGSQGLKRVLSVDKVSIRMNASRLGKSGKAPSPRLLPQPAMIILSKKSTGYSTQSQEEALKEENERFRQLCAAEEGRLLRLEKEIENENKVQLIRRQLYEESIRKLKRMAGEEGVMVENAGHEEGQTEQSCEDCDCLSVASR